MMYLYCCVEDETKVAQSDMTWKGNSHTLFLLCINFSSSNNCAMSVIQKHTESCFNVSFVSNTTRSFARPYTQLNLPFDYGWWIK